MEALINKLEEMIEAKKLSRSSMITLIEQMKKEFHDLNGEFKAIQDDLNDSQRDLSQEEKYSETLKNENLELEEEMLTHSNLIEQQILDEFKERFSHYKRGMLKPNEILKDFKI